MNPENYLYTTVRIKYINKLGYIHNRVGFVQSVTATKLILLALDDDEDCEIIIQIKNIKSIKIPDNGTIQK